jgi:methylase of polypeptide subunit release factors
MNQLPATKTAKSNCVFEIAEVRTCTSVLVVRETLPLSHLAMERMAFWATDKKQEPGMAEDLTFSDEAAALYDQAFAHVTAYFMPFLLRAAGVTPGMRVLDIATGTGLSAEAVLAAVGPTRHVTAADISPAMVAKARERLGDVPNVSLSSRTDRRFHSPTRVSTRSSAISD